MVKLWVKDSNGKQIKIGDILKQKNNGNTALHGEYGYYKIVNRGGFPVMSYLMSDTGYILPPDYLALHLSDLYDPKSLVWVSVKYMPTPCDAEVIVISENELPFKKITAAEWSKIKDQERKQQPKQPAGE